jgi:peptide/nickel transport system permease protein
VVIGLSQLLALLIALPVGVLAAVKPYSWFDRIASTLAFIGFSLPTFFTGILFILFFSITWAGCPSSTAPTSRHRLEWWWEHFKQSIMPVTVLGLFQAPAGCAMCARRCWT